MSNQLEPLRFAAGKRVERLPQPQVTEPDFLEHFQAVGNLRAARVVDLGKEFDRFANRQFQQIGNRSAAQAHFQNVRLKAFAFAFGAAHVKIAQKLHFDLLVTCAGAALAASAAGIE